MVTSNKEIKFPYDGCNSKWPSGYRARFVCISAEIIVCEVKIKPKHLYVIPCWYYSALGIGVKIRGPFKLVYREI